MKRSWTIQRQTQPLLDAQQRWDRAFQLLLPIAIPALTQPIQSADPKEEMEDESRTLRTCLDQSPGPHPIH